MELSAANNTLCARATPRVISRIDLRRFSRRSDTVKARRKLRFIRAETAVIVEARPRDPPCAYHRVNRTEFLSPRQLKIISRVARARMAVASSGSAPIPRQSRRSVDNAERIPGPRGPGENVRSGEDRACAYAYACVRLCIRECVLRAMLQQKFRYGECRDRLPDLTSDMCRLLSYRSLNGLAKNRPDNVDRKWRRHEAAGRSPASGVKVRWAPPRARRSRVRSG